MAAPPFNSPFLSDLDNDPSSSSAPHLSGGTGNSNQQSPFESSYPDFNAPAPGSPSLPQQTGSVPPTPFTASYAAHAGSYQGSPFGSDISFADQQGTFDYTTGANSFDANNSLDYNSFIDIDVVPPGDDYDPTAYDAPDQRLFGFGSDFMAALPGKDPILANQSSSPSLSTSSLGSSHPHVSVTPAHDTFDGEAIRAGTYSPFDQGSPSSSNGDAGQQSTDQFGQTASRSRASSVSSSHNISQPFPQQRQKAQSNATYGFEGMHFSSPSPGPTIATFGNGPQSPPSNKPQSPTLVIPSQSSSTIAPPDITANSPSPTNATLAPDNNGGARLSYFNAGLSAPRVQGGLTPGGPGIQIVPATPVSAGAGHGVENVAFQQSIGQQSSQPSSQQSMSTSSSSQQSWSQSSASPMPTFQQLSDYAPQRSHSRTPSNGTIAPQPQQRLAQAPPSPFTFPPSITPPPPQIETHIKQSPQASPNLGALQLGLDTDQQQGDNSYLLPQSNSRSRSKSDTSLRPPMWQLGINDNASEEETKLFDNLQQPLLPSLGLSGSVSAGNSPSLHQFSSLPHHSSYGPPAQTTSPAGGSSMLEPQGNGNNGFLSPNFTLAPVRRSRSDSAGMQSAGHRRNAVSEDFTRRMQPSSNQLFPPGQSFGFPGIPGGGPPGSNPSSTGGSPLLGGQQYLQPVSGELGGITNISGGLGAHRRSFSHGNSHGHSRSLSRERVSLQANPYPSPHASPRLNTNEQLPNMDSTVQVHVMGVDANGKPTVQSAAPISVPRQNVTTHATADASQRRRRTEANFVCPVPGCGSTFTRHFNLKGHLRSHNEERPFKCKWPGCDKGFARQHDCKRHEQLHLNIRPYVCLGCNRQFARMDALNRHLRSDAGTDCQARQPLLTSDQPNNPSALNNNDLNELQSFSQWDSAQLGGGGVTL